MSSAPPDTSSTPPGLIEAWRADVASPAELRRGYQRFLRAQRRRSFMPKLARRVLVGVILGVGLAQGATLATKYWPSDSPRALTAAAPAPREIETSTALPQPRSSAPAAPASAPAPSNTPAPSPALTRTPATTPALPEASPPFVQEQWQKAAAALRADDFDGADAALRQLERSTQGSEHDAVLLTRAQLSHASQVLAQQGHSGSAHVTRKGWRKPHNNTTRA